MGGPTWSDREWGPAEDGVYLPFVAHSALWGVCSARTFSDQTLAGEDSRPGLETRDLQMKARWLVLGVVLVFSAACSDVLFSANSNRKLIVQGTVTEISTGTPIAGAFVSLEWTPNDTASTSVTRHVDTATLEDGSYRIETELGNVICKTLVLFIGKNGYDAAHFLPKCKGGKQTLNVELRPD